MLVAPPAMRTARAAANPLLLIAASGSRVLTWAAAAAHPFEVAVCGWPSERPVAVSAVRAFCAGLRAEDWRLAIGDADGSPTRGLGARNTLQTLERNPLPLPTPLRSQRGEPVRAVIPLVLGVPLHLRERCAEFYPHPFPEPARVPYL